MIEKIASSNDSQTDYSIFYSVEDKRSANEQISDLII